MTPLRLPLLRFPLLRLPQPLAAAILCMSLLGLAGCTAPPIRDATYVLKPSERVDLAPGVTMTYDSYSDSRCPANAKCIWAGRLEFRFIVAGPDGQEEFTLGPDAPEAVPAALRGARIALELAAVPPARISASRPAELMPVALRVTHP